MRARAFFNANKYRQAETAARRAFDLVPKRKRADALTIEIARVELRDILVRLKKWKSGEMVLNKALRRLPKSEWLSHLADLTRRRKEWEPPLKRRHNLHRIK